MIEVEIKVCIYDVKETEKKLLETGFEKGLLLKESDIYFDSAIQPLRKNDMALRIRCCEHISEGTKECFMTYKGPKLDSISMTRKELEMGIESEQIGEEILKSLGYQPIHPVVKIRQCYCKDTMTACLDQVTGLGDFLELEIVVEKEEEKEAALKKIMDLLYVLGYEKRKIIRTSYLSMLQKKMQV